MVFQIVNCLVATSTCFFIPYRTTSTNAVHSTNAWSKYTHNDVDVGGLPFHPLKKHCLRSLIFFTSFCGNSCLLFLHLLFFSLVLLVILYNCSLLQPFLSAVYLVILLFSLLCLFTSASYNRQVHLTQGKRCVCKGNDSLLFSVLLFG